MFDCRLFIEKYPGWEVRSRIGLAGVSMGEQQQQQQQQLRDAMRTFGVVFFYGPTVLQSTLHPYTLTSLQTCRETGGGNITVTL